MFLKRKLHGKKKNRYVIYCCLDWRQWTLKDIKSVIRVKSSPEISSLGVWDSTIKVFLHKRLNGWKVFCLARYWNLKVCNLNWGGEKKMLLFVKHKEWWDVTVLKPWSIYQADRNEQKHLRSLGPAFSSTSVQLEPLWGIAPSDIWELSAAVIDYWQSCANVSLFRDFSATTVPKKFGQIS